MERLTTNKRVSEMSMFELACNCCYVDKNGNARYRDFDTDVDARDLAMWLNEKYLKEEPPQHDDDFDEIMHDRLQYGFETLEGLIAVFYQKIWAMTELRERLKRYEDAEEQGLLLRLPCEIGDTVFWATEKGVLERYVASMDLTRKNHVVIKLQPFGLDVEKYPFSTIAFSKEFGVSIFLTKEEAEKALAERGK